MNENKPKNVKKQGYIITLIFIIVFAVLISILAYLNVKSIIRTNEIGESNKAYTEAFGDAAFFESPEYDRDMLDEYLVDSGYDKLDVVVNNVIYARNDDNAVIGTLVEVSVYKKFGGIINFIVGVNNDGSINGYSVLNISDAKGLDLWVNKDSFKNQFIGKKVSEFKLVSTTPEKSNEILEIKGGSDASGAIVTGINAAIIANTFIDESVGVGY